MSLASALHVAAMAALVLVAWSGLSVLLRRWDTLPRLDRLGVMLSTGGALYWLAMSVVLSNVLTCRAADPTLCIAGGLYHLVRNGSDDGKDSCCGFTQALSRPGVRAAVAAAVQRAAAGAVC